jgi:hypothetical protein
MGDQGNGLLTIKRAAGELGVHRNTVKGYIDRGLLETTWQGGYRIARGELDRFKREAAQTKVETGRLG